MKIPANVYFKECENNKTIFNQITQRGLGIVSIIIINFYRKWLLVLGFLLMFQGNLILFMARKLIASNYLWWKYLHQRNNEMLQIKAFYLLTFYIGLLNIHPEKAMTLHSSTVAWEIPWMEEPGRLQSMGPLRVGHNWATSLSLFTFTHWRRKWQPTPVFLPGGSQGQRSQVGFWLRGRTESDTTDVT